MLTSSQGQGFKVENGSRRSGPAGERIDVLLVEGDSGFSRHLQQALTELEIDTIVAASLREARHFLRELPIELDAALIDVRLPDGKGEDLLPDVEALANQPGVVILGDVTQTGAQAAMYRAVLAPKTISAFDLADLLRLAARGYTVSTLHRFAGRFHLSRRETEILLRMVQGASLKWIASDLGCSLQAIYGRLASVRVKTESTDYLEVVAKLFRFSCNGLGHHREQDPERVLLATCTGPYSTAAIVGSSAAEGEVPVVVESAHEDQPSASREASTSQ